ncbi:MAG: efflux RND transporter permease subunit, partial [Saprospiraceae bacterium]|nr:efflux RND transporter permease subunit [Saprospiraceae bacterium]
TREEVQFNKTYWDPRLMGNTPLEGYDVVLSPTLPIKSDFLGQSFFRTRSGLLLPTMAFSDVRRSSDFKVVQGDLAVGEQRQIQQRLLLLASTLLLLYLLLAILFNDLSLPFYVLAVLPAGLGGAVIALYIGGDSLNIVALTGIVLVCGIVVNDAILKVDLVVRLSRTLSVEKAVMQAARERWRAIVMTSLTTAVSLAPAIWGSEFSHVFQRPLALAVIGGLLGGTLASLWFIPHLFKSKL